MPCFASAAVPGKRRFALTKRLQRARKFLGLVDALGEAVLQVVPEVCVSRLDLVKLEDVTVMLHDDRFANEVATIRARLIQMAIPPVSDIRRLSRQRSPLGQDPSPLHD